MVDNIEFHICSYFIGTLHKIANLHNCASIDDYNHNLLITYEHNTVIHIIYFIIVLIVRETHMHPT